MGTVFKSASQFFKFKNRNPSLTTVVGTVVISWSFNDSYGNRREKPIPFNDAGNNDGSRTVFKCRF